MERYYKSNKDTSRCSFLYPSKLLFASTKLIEGLTGERAIYKRRGERAPEVRLHTLLNKIKFLVLPLLST